VAGEQKNPIVLVVDDEHAIADTLAIILNQSGFEATAAYSGETAVETARQLQPDFLVSDVVLGGLNGIEAAILIRAFLPGCRVLLLSGQQVTADLLEPARARGYEFDILAKPLHPTDLLIRMHSL
jgi:DNA-binding response OmpR family regulator